MAKSIKLLVLTIGFLALGLAETFGGQIRFVGGGIPAYRPAIAFRSMPMMRQMPVYRMPVNRPGVVPRGPGPLAMPRYEPREPAYREAPRVGMGYGRREYNPYVFQGLRPGRSTVYGRLGMHPVRNETNWPVIAPRPGLVFTAADGSVTDGPLDIEQMIDETDFGTPLEEVAGCAEDCRWGAVSISNDGTSATSWNYATMAEAQQAANSNCAQVASEQCFAYAAAGAAWIAGVQCEMLEPDGSFVHRGGAALGNDLSAAIRNAFRAALQDGTFVLDQCALKTYVAANGAQTLIDQPVPEPAPVVADNPAPTSQPPVIEERSVAKDNPKPADGPTPSSYWTFYGSDMYMTKDGSKRAFFFDSPRSGLADLGIGHGSPFFEGSIDGSIYRGEVFAYAKNCPSMSYPVVGKLSADEKHITFVGDRPSRDDQCNITATKKVTISFDFNRGAEDTSAE